MRKVGKFEKVNFNQFYDDILSLKDNFEVSYGTIIYNPKYNGTGNSDDVAFKDAVSNIYEKIKLPTRATRGSAGYDFKSPFSFTLNPGETIKIPTGIRVKINSGWWLGCLPRSGLGFKYRLQLDNTMGVIDSDFYYSDNEGHIFAKITNDGKEGKELTVHLGQGFMQGIFIPYGVTYGDKTFGIRNGGMGSTDK